MGKQSLIRSIVFMLLTVLFSGQALAGNIVYEDAEDGAIDRWTVFDNTPAGAVINNVFDTDKNSHVIEFTGTGADNGYMLGNVQGRQGAWNNTQEKKIQWSMKFAERFYLYISVQTQKGHRYLYYTNTAVGNDFIQEDRGSTYIHYGLGSASSNGTWQTFTRDLDADLQQFEADNTLLTINAFLVRGSGSMDDVSLFSDEPVDHVGEDTTYEDAEDGTTTGWSVYDNSPSGAVINNVFDDEKQSKVIELSGSNTENGYMLGNWEGREGAWNNTQAKTVQWSMKYDEFFYIYINVETQNGQRYIYYTNRSEGDNFEELNGGTRYIHYGLGSSSNNGAWQTYTRNLEADLNAFEPDNSILSVNGFLIRGSGRIDDINMLVNAAPVVTGKTILFEDAEDGQVDGWSIYDNSPAGAVINNVLDTEKSSRVISFTGNGSNNGYMLGNLPGKQGDWNETEARIIEWSMKYNERFYIYISVQTQQGQRYLTYTSEGRPEGAIETVGGATYIEYGLGASSQNGTWQTYSRNLQADLSQYEAGNDIVSVNGFLIRGSGSVDDITMKTQDALSNTSQAGVLLTFDDRSVDLWYDYFKDKDTAIKATFFVHAWHALSADEINKLRLLESRGHEIGVHSYSHKGVIRDFGGDDTRIQEYLDTEIVPALTNMRADGFDPVSFAYPYGETTDNYNAALRPYFRSLRTTTYSGPSRPLETLDPIYDTIGHLDYLLSGDGIDLASDNEVPEIERAFDRASSNEEIITLIGHRIYPDNDPNADFAYSLTVSKLDQIIAAAQAKGLQFYTVKQVFELRDSQ